ncbi:MAG TPA: hypothetical protein VFI90_00570 [Rubrobacter sp.]|nr:hypothetical protein [Rubrobacter sp.]
MNEAARGGFSEVWTRAALGFLSLGELAVGIWALFLPRSFYEDFPSSGRDWVSTLGPYDEHLMRDVGAFNLAFGVLFVLAAILLERRLIQASLVAYLVYAVPHFIFHLTQTHAFSVGDNLAQLVSLGLQIALPAAILVGVGLRGQSKEVPR